MNQIRSGFLVGAAAAALAAIVVMNWRRGSRQRAISQRTPEVIRWEGEGGSVPEISEQQPSPAATTWTGATDPFTLNHS